MLLNTLHQIRFTGNRATGVEYVKRPFPGTRLAEARLEVIICAGAIGTPQLLMLSGIGRKAELQRLQIPLLADLPVGENLQDHPIIGGVSATMCGNHGIDTRNLSMVTDYIINRSGPLTVAAGAENQAFLNSALASSGLDRPDTQAFLVSLSLATEEGEVTSKFLGVKQEVYDRYYKPNRDKNSFMIVPVVLRPASRGRVTLKSARYTDHPIIDPRYFSDPRDLQTAIEVLPNGNVLHA
ncbi:L-sorbose 1-dehydrogenase-like [Ornithodoros turicata]|uniref:L-sorbose 1-dehydrogenase-like n=1 Tax=Ornithodoros turicata TaxID=34597 RepID=UPI0031392BC8